jgi:mono/diheme cytochrome c family protein
MRWRQAMQMGLALALAATGFGLARATPLVTAGERVERGRYLVSAIGCGACHTPKAMTPAGLKSDASRFLAGHPEGASLGPPPSLAPGPWVAVSAWDTTAWAGPWGVSYSANLTPDENTGIGSWSEETFVRALRTGRHMGVSRPILPPMPWGAFRNFSDEDLRSIYAYLKTVPPVRNRVPEPLPPPESRSVSRGGGRESDSGSSRTP